MNALLTQCRTYAEANETKNAKDKRTAAGISAAGGAVVGGLLTWGVTRSIMDAKVNSAEQAAIQEFMDNVGSKIHCYIGADEAGTYGDVIQTKME